ncbi:hypothetical protein TorRG33x02_301640 [Trema orientale]|uniref:Uncharacterized protein n=1 Tax=Trema orientale TaxID=63057 RepID=A0A2P5C0Z1_TREOI|nr:hypothetical protein TorRG33x02_301640 [Trema orientale]
MNVDASVYEKASFIGIGVVIRNSNGQVRGATTKIESDSKKTCSTLKSFDPLSKESPILSDIIVILSLLGNAISETPTRVSTAVYEDCELQ